MIMFAQEFAPEWNRSADSLYTEWEAHNLFSAFSSRAMNCDFDNMEEGKGYWYYFKKAYYTAKKSLFK